MDEARRFLRYVTPGLVFIIYLWLFLFLSNPEGFFKITVNVLKATNVGLPVALFITSGGLGFIFSIMHHFLTWRICAPIDCSFLNRFTMDYRGALIGAESKGKLVIHSQQGKPIEAKRLTIPGAWRVVTCIWQERVDSASRFKGADSRTTSLCDLMHGSGATFVAWAASVLAGFLILTFVIGSLPSIWSWAVAALLLTIHLLNHIFLVEHSLSITQSILLDEILDPSEKNAIRPVVVVVSDREFKSMPQVQSRPDDKTN
jgi:hypothetical protein